MLTPDVDGYVGMDELSLSDGEVAEGIKGIDKVPTEDTGWATQLVDNQAVSSTYANHVTGLRTRPMRHIAQRTVANFSRWNIARRIPAGYHQVPHFAKAPKRDAQPIVISTQPCLQVTVEIPPPGKKYAL